MACSGHLSPTDPTEVSGDMLGASRRRGGRTALRLHRFRRSSSHQSLGDTMDGSSVRDVLSKEQADEFARRAAELQAADKSGVAAVAVQSQAVQKGGQDGGDGTGALLGPSAVLGLSGTKRGGRASEPRRSWRGKEPLWHAFEWLCLVVRPSGQSGWRGRAGKCPGPMPRITSVLLEGGGREAKASRPGAVCMRSRSRGDHILLVFCSLCGAYQLTLLRRLMFKCSRYLERQAEVRSPPHLWAGRHPTRPSPLDGRPLSGGTHGAAACALGVCPWLRALAPFHLSWSSSTSPKAGAEASPTSVLNVGTTIARGCNARVFVCRLTGRNAGVGLSPRFPLVGDGRVGQSVILDLLTDESV